MKSTVDEIRARFDHDVERFANLETGQSATIDAPLCLELVAEAAAATTPQAKSLLDIGCGAGNYTLKLLEQFKHADATLIDLSRPLLDRAEQQFDVAVAAAVLHHLRSADEWSSICDKVFASLRPGGSFWIVDLVSHNHGRVQQAMWRRYGRYLSELRDAAYREQVFGYVEKEDTPVPVMTIVDHLRTSGFVGVEVLHKNNCFAALGAVKPVLGIDVR